jgi:hypothetical protein
MLMGSTALTRVVVLGVHREREGMHKLVRVRILRRS